MDAMQRLLDIMARLRDPQDGCEWDLQQDFQSLTKHTLEEAHEVVDAIQRNDIDDIRDELGDLLLQVVFYCQIAREDNLFDFSAVANGLSDKLIRRHPYIFGDQVASSPEQRRQAWEQIKSAERQARSESVNSRLDGVSPGFPALIHATKLQQRASNAGFDWSRAEPVLAKIKEELAEVEEVLPEGDQSRIEDEIGDLLFAVVNLTRHCQVDAETALRQASMKFSRRFQYIEAKLEETGRVMEDTDLVELDSIWDEAKAKGVH
ncbi:MAG: nucleoside triphosphate pyrophosphohydrolase [Gammaproteobacteria bacterium]|nr:nucleoside triphosphate pyrophosphohydrolase [Gammaproteobacteria bacterium]